MDRSRWPELERRCEIDFVDIVDPAQLHLQVFLAFQLVPVQVMDAMLPVGTIIGAAETVESRIIAR
jgi:hypothetical protein